MLLNLQVFNSCDFNSVYIYTSVYAMHLVAEQRGSHLCPRPSLSSAPCEAGCATRSLRDFIIQPKEQGEQLVVLWIACHPLILPHYAWQEFVNSAQSLPASERQLPCLALVPVMSWCQWFVRLHSSRHVWQPWFQAAGNTLCLLPVVAPFSPPTGIQLWSFCCCQPCWLQQSAFYSLTKALLSPCFLLCHCVLKNLPKVMWVLMARNLNLTVI